MIFWTMRKHWPAVIVLVLGLVRNLRGEQSSSLELVCISVAGAGVLMNLLVILLNGGMPVACAADQITEEELPHYRPIDPQTRLPFLADWIDVGWAFFSPGDFLICAGAAGLILRALDLFWIP